MGKDLGSMLSGIGKGIMDNPVGGLHLGKEALEINPGMKMFGMSGGNGGKSEGMSFLDQFRQNLSQQLFMNAMQGFRGGGM